MKFSPLFLLLTALVLPVLPLAAQVPQALNYQGRVAVNGNTFTGIGQFRFALVDGAGAVLWSSHASAATPVSVAAGLYSVRLGDTTLPNMAAVPSALFANADLRLRVWFDDGVNGPQQLAPDQRLAPVGYAHRAASADSVPASAIAPGSIQPSHLAKSRQNGFEDMYSEPRAGEVRSVTFDQPFESVPTIIMDGETLPAANVTTTGFTYNTQVHGLVIDDGIPAANEVGKWIDMILVSGNPAIAYTDDTSGDLKFVRASNPTGSAWDPPMIIVTGGAAIVGAYCSLAIVNGNPAIAYYDETNKDLKYIRAANATGSAWNSPITVAAHATNDLGKGCRLKTFTGSTGTTLPYIAYLDATAGTVRVITGSNNNGGSWGAPQTPDPTLSGLTDPTAIDLDVTPAGDPVVAYHHPGTNQLRLTASPIQIPGVWAAPQTISQGIQPRAVDIFTRDGDLAVKFTNDQGVYSGEQAYNGFSTEAIAGPYSSSRVVEGPVLTVVTEDPTYNTLSVIRTTSTGGNSWRKPKRFFAALVYNSPTIGAVRLSDGSVLAAYRAANGNGQLAVSNTAAPPSGQWAASTPSALQAASLAPGALTMADLPTELFGEQNFRGSIYSFAAGRNCEALGNYSVALGQRCVAGEYGFAAGYVSTAGRFGVALGRQANAAGENSTALGTSTKATGRSSTAMGFGSNASGLFSTASGFYTTAETYAETSLGSYPTTNTGNANAWVATDRLFEIGNGTLSNSQSNALTILKNGRIGLGSMDDSSEITHDFTLSIAASGRALSWTTYSDSRIKTEQQPLSYGLAEIMRLQPRAYNQHGGCLRDGTFQCEDETPGGKPTIGFIAQEVAQVIPEAVEKPEDPANQLYGMDYQKLVPVLVKATQELKTENDTLKAQLQAMEARLQRLETPAH